MLNSFGVIRRNDSISNHSLTLQLLVDLCQGLLQVGPDDEQVFGRNMGLDHTTRCNTATSVAYGSLGLDKHRCVLLMLAQGSGLESDSLGIRGAKWDFVAAGDWHLSQQSILDYGRAPCTESAGASPSLFPPDLVLAGVIPVFKPWADTGQKALSIVSKRLCRSYRSEAS